MEYLTTKEVADMIGVTRQRVIQLVNEKKIPAITKDGRFFIHQSDAESYERVKPTGRPCLKQNLDSTNTTP
jgi:excisionase family DNA binding protein